MVTIMTIASSNASILEIRFSFILFLSPFLRSAADIKSLNCRRNFTPVSRSIKKAGQMRSTHFNRLATARFRCSLQIKTPPCVSPTPVNQNPYRACFLTQNQHLARLPTSLACQYRLECSGTVSKAPSSQWRDRAGFSPASILAPVGLQAAPPENTIRLYSITQLL